MAGVGILKCQTANLVFMPLEAHHSIPYALLFGASGPLDLDLRAPNQFSLSFPLFLSANQPAGLAADSADPLGFYVNCKTKQKKKIRI